ncbi:MAG: serine/threonine protein phosphatase 1 [Flavobacterium sp.]|jgi:serine/threonine protein phosphatase 1
MNRNLVIGDIHGGLKALKQVIERANVTQNDTLIFLGDYVDGWNESPQVLDFLIELNKKQKCVFIRGNHDDLLLNYLKTNSYHLEWLKHGGKSTIDAYEKRDESTKQKHISFLEELVSNYLDNENRLFIHAGFTNLKGIEFEHFKPLFYWDRTLWELALALDENIPIESELYPSRLKLYKEIYIGHTPTTKINQTVPVNKACIWNVDTGAAFTGPLTILDIETKEFWQSDFLPSLYSNENGRN